jgi:hypothetical protein
MVPWRRFGMFIGGRADMHPVDLPFRDRDIARRRAHNLDVGPRQPADAPQVQSAKPGELAFAVPEQQGKLQHARQYKYTFKILPNSPPDIHKQRLRSDFQQNQ